MAVNLTTHPLGRSEIEYGGYSGAVSGKVEDHDLSHETTPRYEVSIFLRGSDAVCHHVERNVGVPVWETNTPSLFGALLGGESEKTRRPLTPVVEKCIRLAFDEIDEIHASTGQSPGDEKSPTEVAERVVSEWDFTEVGDDTAGDAE
jgi:hypothetical protein